MHQSFEKLKRICGIRSSFTLQFEARVLLDTRWRQLIFVNKDKNFLNYNCGGRIRVR